MKPCGRHSCREDSSPREQKSTGAYSLVLVFTFGHQETSWVTKQQGSCSKVIVICEESEHEAKSRKLQLVSLAKHR